MSDILLKKQATPTLPSAGKVKYFVTTGGAWSSIDETGLVKTYAEGITTEQVEDIVGTLLQASPTVSVSYNDPGNIISFTVNQSALDHVNFLNIGVYTHEDIDFHIEDQDNPHSVTKAQVGLGNVDNTSDLNKPISTATQTALNLKYDASNPNGYETPTQLNVRDTANRTRANHTGTQSASTISDFSTAADARITAQKGVANGIATLDASVKIPTTQIPALPYAPTSHTHTSSEITDFTTAVETIGDARYSLLGHTHPDATTTVSGFMSHTDKVKLDGLSNDVFLRQTTTYSNTSNVTYVTCPQLAVTCVAGRLYKIKWSIRHTSAATTTGFRPGLGGTAVGTVNFVGSVVQSTTSSTTNIISGPLSAYNTNIAATSSAGTQPTIAEIEGIFICSTSGVIYPQFLSETSGTQVNVLPDSLCIYKEIT